MWVDVFAELGYVVVVRQEIDMAIMAKVFLLLVFHSNVHGDITSVKIPMASAESCKAEQGRLLKKYESGGFSGTRLEIAECVTSGE